MSASQEMPRTRITNVNVPNASCHPPHFRRAPALPLSMSLETLLFSAAVLLDAREELLQLFDLNVGITGKAELAELDGPVVRLRLSGRFWCAAPHSITASSSAGAAGGKRPCSAGLLPARDRSSLNYCASHARPGTSRTRRHQRALVVLRVGAYLQLRIPEILEVEASFPSPV